MKENKRYLDCKYLDAGMDGMLCSRTLCAPCKEFFGEKCDYYTSKNRTKDKTGKIKIIMPPKYEYASSCLICGKTVKIYNQPTLASDVCEDCKKAIEYAKELMKRSNKMTNEEWIKSLTGEDFVRELMHFSSCLRCPCYEEESCKNIGCTKGKLKWLQEEHNTEEKEK